MANSIHDNPTIIERLGLAMQAVSEGLAGDPDGGHLHIGRKPEDDDHASDRWIVGLEWGREAPDSPMAGAAAYGIGETMVEALESALSDTGWKR